jgi:glycosyltransferase involved in cell wall biosynthesis
MEVVLGVDAIKYPLTGIGRYAYELAKGLQFSSDIEKLYFLKGVQIQTNLELIEATPNAVAGGKLNNRFRSLLGSVSPVVMAYQLRLGWRQEKTLKPYKNTIFHGPNYYLPKHDGPCVSTFHDLSIFKYPAFHPQARRAYMARELPKALKRADVIITDSNYTREEVIEYSGFDPSRVLAIPLAASEEFKPRTEIECQETLSKFQLIYKNYVLYAGTVEPRKNLNSLLDAYESLPEKLRLYTPLVVAGYKGWRSEDVHERLEKAHVAGWAKYLGFVSAKDLPVLFSAAKAFVYPSIYEGFGLPVLEALASGVPVVCSDASSLPEVAGEAALMCEHADVNTLTQLLIKSLEDQEWRQTAIRLGLQQAATFSWQKTVDKTIDAYKLAATLKGV